MLTVALVLRYLSSPDPRLPSARGPCSRPVYLGTPPGFGEPALPCPPTLEFVSFPLGVEGSGGSEGKSLPPRCCSSFPREREPSTPCHEQPGARSPGPDSHGPREAGRASPKHPGLSCSYGVEVPIRGLGQCVFLVRLVLHFFSSLADRERSCPSSGVCLLLTPICSPHSGADSGPRFPLPLPTHKADTYMHTHHSRPPPRSPGVTCPRRLDTAGAHPSLLHLFPSQLRLGTAFRRFQGQLRLRPPGASLLGAQAGPKILLSTGEFLRFLPYLSSASSS